MSPEWMGSETARRLSAGPLAPQIAGFVAALRAQGYSTTNIRSKLTFVAQLGRWLERRRLAPAGFDDVRLHEFLRDRRRRYRSAAAAAATTRQLARYLRVAADMPRQPTAPSRDAAARLEVAYTEYLRRERALADVTIVNYVSLVHPFLTDRGHATGRTLARIGASDVTRFVVEQARRLGPGRTKLLVTALRSLLRFLHWTGRTSTDLALNVPRVANWQHARLPKYIPAADVRRLIRSCDLHRPAGRRDRAVLLLLARLGLRACEVVRLTLDDVDWRGGEVLVRGKGARLDRLPLPREVGDALVAYLRDARPRGGSRHVFQCARAPRHRLSNSSTVSTIVRRAIERAGLRPPSKGAHLLRHSLATTLLRRGAPLAEIGSLLRHHSPDTTALYAKVNLGSLRDIALPWPAGAA